MIDRFTRWPEVAPLPDMTADTVAKAFFATWISRFGAPSRLTTDQGRQFESSLFNALTRMLGVERIHTTAYHPQANGLIENLHRTLKAALSCHQTTQWTAVLPAVLLGLRASIKEDLQCTPAELLYGSTIRLPGEFFDSSTASDNSTEYVQQLRNCINKLRPHSTTSHGSRSTFVHKDLGTATHVFVRRDFVRKPLTTPYDGPYKVLDRRPKAFKLQIRDQARTVSIDRLKPAFILNPQCDITPVLTPQCDITPVLTPQCDITPVLTPQCDITPVLTPQCDITPTPIPQCTTSSTPNRQCDHSPLRDTCDNRAAPQQPSYTRSGRRVRFPDYFVSSR